MPSFLEQFWNRLKGNPLFFLNPNHVVDMMNDTGNDIQVENLLKQAETDPLKASGDIANQNLIMSPEQEKYLDSLIENQKTEANNAFQEHMRDTALTSAAGQLSDIGLSPSGVLQTGGAASGVTSSPAGHPLTNLAMQRYQHNLSLAKQIIGMTSSMASAGIYGHALAAAKKSAGILAATTAHSGLVAMHHSRTIRGQRGVATAPLRTGNEPGLTPDEEWWN